MFTQAGTNSIKHSRGWINHCFH